MINIRDNAVKQRLRTQLERRWIIFERAFSRDIRKILKSQFKAAAQNVEAYNLDFYYSIDKYKSQMEAAFHKHYKRIFKNFGEDELNKLKELKGFESYETKSFVEEFWRFANPWMIYNTANRIVQVTLTTKKIINGIVRREMQAGSSNKDIADKITSVSAISNPLRALRIAKTETHSAANYATDQAMDSSRIIKQKEWLSALDERTRTEPFNHVIANGERVDMEDTFKRTGENLKYPGDPDGSAGNIIHCRCVTLYHTDTQIQRGGG